MNITKVERAPEGFWRARVGGCPVDRRYGVWGTPPGDDGSWREVLPVHAQRLQKKVATHERRESNATKE